MKIFKKILKIVSLILLVIVFVGFLFITYVKKRSLPNYNKDVALAGVLEDVEVFSDSSGVFHIYADNENDLYISTGYVMARERMWQMDLLRRVTLGRLSEIFGSDYISTDVLLRSLGYAKKSKNILKELSNEELQCLENYSKGVNLYIDEYNKKLPFEFMLLGYKPEYWKPEHTLNLIGYMAWDLKAGWSQFLLTQFRQTLDSTRYYQLFPDVVKRTDAIFNSSETPVNFGNNVFANLFESGEKLFALSAEPLVASNNWAVDAKNSETSKPLLANDMHLSFGIPGIWMQIHQVVKNKFNVTGLALPGGPTIIAGHNAGIAWGLTNTYVDNVDFYEEKMNPNNPLQYLYEGEWLDIKVEKELIKIKGGDSVLREINYTHRGRIVSEFKRADDKVLSMHWMGDEISNEFRTVYRLNKAKNWNEFLDAVQYFKAISQNIVYADTSGNIGLHTCAGVPIRKREFGKLILPGWTSEYDWKGFVPFNELPHMFNPKSGMLLSANNKTIDNKYPYHIGTWYSLPYRYNRIEKLLQETNKHTVNSFKQIQCDANSSLVNDILPDILNVLNNYKDYSKSELAALIKLNEWNGFMSRVDITPLIFETFYHEIIKSVFADELDTLFVPYLSASGLPKRALFTIWNNEESPWWDNVNTSDIESKNNVIRSSFKNTINEIKVKYGEDAEKWQWGNMHQITLQHPLGKVDLIDRIFNLNRGSFPVNGSFHTISPYSYNFSKLYEVNHGASHRHIFDLADWDNSQTVIPTGNSGVPSNEFYCNQTELYMNYEYHAHYYTRYKVEQHAKYKFIIKGK